MEARNQTPPTKEYAARFLEQMHSDATCDWCKHPEKSLYRAGLCRHCYNISREVSKLESLAQKYKEIKRPVSFDLDLRLKAARKMVHLAKMEGSAYGDIHTKHVTGLDIEHLFSRLSKALIKKDLYYGAVNVFDRSFSPDQKRLIYYLLSKLWRERLRRSRRSAAMVTVEPGS